MLKANYKIMLNLIFSTVKYIIVTVGHPFGFKLNAVFIKNRSFSDDITTKYSKNITYLVFTPYL